MCLLSLSATGGATGTGVSPGHGGVTVTGSHRHIVCSGVTSSQLLMEGGTSGGIKFPCWGSAASESGLVPEGLHYSCSTLDSL